MLETIANEALLLVSGGEFAGYRDAHEWRQATFGDVKQTWDPSRNGGFAGYATRNDWSRATFGR
jgi:hypothetical protein